MVRSAHLMRQGPTFPDFAIPHPGQTDLKVGADPGSRGNRRKTALYRTGPPDQVRGFCVMTNALPQEAADVLAFWFEELKPEQWWSPDPGLDATVTERFAGLYESLAEEVPEAWLSTPSGCLAAVIVLDQFPRNMFRDDPRAFAKDPAALALTKDAIERGLDSALNATERGLSLHALSTLRRQSGSGAVVGAFHQHR